MLEKQMQQTKYNFRLFWAIYYSNAVIIEYIILNLNFKLIRKMMLKRNIYLRNFN